DLADVTVPPASTGRASSDLQPRPKGPARAALRNSMIRSGLARAVVLPITSVAALYTARIELGALGTSGFGILTLLLTITLLLPFADLGIGAAVTNAVAAHPARDRQHEVVAASLRLLLVAGVGVVAIAAGLTACNVWH